MVTFDFETEAIVGNPISSPPRPVGVAIKQDAGKSIYYGWGHPTENNCTWEQGRTALLTALRNDSTWLAHNAAFESAILRQHFNVEKRDPLKFHDTQYLIFLIDPYAFSFALKASADRILGIPASEQDVLRAWVLANVPQATSVGWGGHIAKAPGGLVGIYAKGDTDRTYELFKVLHANVHDANMVDAYQREQRLMPILSRSSMHGVRLDVAQLQQDVEKYTQARLQAEQGIFKQLGVEFNIDSDAELAAALDKAGQVTDWTLTPTGKRSTARRNLAGKLKHPALEALLAYRGVLATCLGTFAGPWLQQAQAGGGRVYPQWNQVRGDRGTSGDVSGARTGRMSCKDPNLQNPPNDFEGLAVPPGYPPPILMRKYLLPDEGHTWIKRDFSSQEMRILAHFAEGKLASEFTRHPATDPHATVQRIIFENSGVQLSRKYVKITGFGIMYGRGIANLSAALGVSPVEGTRVRDAYFAALPEVRNLSSETRRCGRMGVPIRTWGTRRYFREPNPDRDLSYKLLNYLIQGSAADQTKQCIIDYDQARGPHEVFLAAVHDEMNVSVPVGAPLAMARLQGVMDEPRFDVPFKSEGFCGRSWGQLEKVNDE